jgi:hypothetical protein
MKHIVKVILLGVIFGVFLMSQGCKKDKGPGESIEDIQLGKLSKTWIFTSVELDGQAQTGYDNFALTISGTAGNTSFGYSVNGRPATSPWPASGAWSFGVVPETQIVRDPDSTNDRLDLTYSVSDTQLQITFNFTGTGYPGGRTNNVNGQWVFTLNP